MVASLTPPQLPTSLRPRLPSPPFPENTTMLAMDKKSELVYSFISDQTIMHAEESSAWSYWSIFGMLVVQLPLN